MLGFVDLVVGFARAVNIDGGLVILGFVGLVVELASPVSIVGVVVLVGVTVLGVFMVFREADLFLDLAKVVASGHRVFQTQARDLLNNRLHDKLDTDFHRASQVRDEDADE
jgi:hypothetical protein